MKNNIEKKAVLLVLSVLLLLTIFYQCLTRNEVEMYWEKYVNSEYGLSFSYPGWWKNVEIIASDDNPNDQIVTNILITANNNYGNTYVKFKVSKLEVHNGPINQYTLDKYLGMNRRYSYYYADIDESTRNSLDTNTITEIAGVVATFSIDKALDPLTIESDIYTESTFLEDKYRFQITLPSEWSAYTVKKEITSLNGLESGNSESVQFNAVESVGNLNNFSVRIIPRWLWNELGFEKCVITPSSCQDTPGNYISKNNQYVYLYLDGPGKDGNDSPELMEARKKIANTFKPIE